MIVTVPDSEPLAGVLSRTIVFAALRESLAKLAPRAQFQNFATLGVYVGSISASIIGLITLFSGTDGGRRGALLVAVAAWLWLSVLMASFAEDIALAWAKARALLRSLGSVHAKRLLGAGAGEAAAGPSSGRVSLGRRWYFATWRSSAGGSGRPHPGRRHGDRRGGVG